MAISPSYSVYSQNLPCLVQVFRKWQDGGEAGLVNLEGQTLP